MITQETAAMIWECYREVAAATKLLDDLRAAQQQNPGYEHEQTLKNVFGHRCDLQLGVPSGDASHQLFGVSPKLAETVIRAHFAAKQAELVELNERARLELDAQDSPSLTPDSGRGALGRPSDYAAGVPDP